MGVYSFKEASCCIQHYIMVYEGRTTRYFFLNTIKHHVQLFLQLCSRIHCANGSVVAQESPHEKELKAKGKIIEELISY